MGYLVGTVLALAVGGLATIIRLDRDRAFYPTVLIVVASYYALFAVMGGTSHTILAEAVPIALFVAAAVAGFRISLWIVVIGLAGHGVFDAVHGSLVADPGVPLWWPPFCMAYDVVAAGYLAMLLARRRVPVNPV